MRLMSSISSDGIGNLNVANVRSDLFCVRHKHRIAAGKGEMVHPCCDRCSVFDDAEILDRGVSEN